jgi:hypothetical protein
MKRSPAGATHALALACCALFPIATPAQTAPIITGLTWHRAVEPPGLIATFAFSEVVHQDRIRLLLDVDGAAHGEARFGADIMVEGPHVYEHTGDGDWSWKQRGPAPTFVSSNRMAVLLAPFPDAKVVRAVAELTGEDWSIQSRFPTEGQTLVQLSEMPVVQWRELTGTPVDPSMDVRDAAPFQTSDGTLGFQVTVAAHPDMARIRLMMDTNGTESGWAEFGIDVMAEGALTFRYPLGETEWRWQGLGSVVSAVQTNSLLVMLPGVQVGQVFRWYAESFNPNWEVISRFPAEGVVTSEVANLPEAPALLQPKPVDLSDLLAFMPETLSRRMQRDFVDQPWKPVVPLPSLPGVLIPGSSEMAALFGEFIDAESGIRLPLIPDRAEQAGALMKWSGRIDDTTTWFLIRTSSDDHDVDLVGGVVSSVERCFRLTVGVTYPEAAWTWHDDMSFRAEMNGTKKYAHDYASPYGLMQRRSYYPFGVISSPDAVLVAELDGREPRQFQIEALSSENKLALHLDMAATPLTGHFPGLAAFHARFRSEARSAADPFRAVLQSWYDRDPDWYVARTPRHGLWLPFTDINTINHADDFQFAYFEKVGPLGRDVDTAHKEGVLNFPYTEPWLYWLPLPDPSTWNRDAAEARMRELASIGIGKERDFASSGYLGASRDAQLHRRITFLNTPWSNGGRMEVNTDPELPVTAAFPVNRAMAEWRYIQEVLADPRVDGIYLDSMSAMETIDYNPEALKVADYPATFVLADRKPGLAMPVQAVEFTAALGRYLKSRGKFLMGNFPCWKFPFFMPYIDVPGEETTWYSGNQFTPLSGRELNYRRAISGAKPFGFLQATHFDQLTRSDMEKYFRECLYFAFMPSFFSHDGANDPYWVDAAMYERDRSLFRTYLPLTIRLSNAGWRPVPEARFESPALRIEQFGRSADDTLFLTVRNTISGEVKESLHLSEAVGPRYVYDFFSGTVQAWSGSGEEPTLSASPSEITCLALIRPAAVPAEVAALMPWTSNDVIYAAAVRNLSSLQREENAGVRCEVRQKNAVVGNDLVPLTLIIANRGTVPVSVHAITATDGRFDIAPGGREEIELSPDVRRGPDGWMRVAWTVDVDGAAIMMERQLRPWSIEPYRVTAPGARMQSDRDSAMLEYVVVGRRAEPTPITMTWRSGDDEGTETREIAFDQPALFRIELPRDGHDTRLVSATFTDGGQVIHEAGTHVVFAPVLNHKGMKTDVRITADSAYSGYTTAVLNDGVVETAGLNWNEAAFATTETSEAHWIRYEFASPETLSSVTIVWNREGGATYASRCGEIWVTSPDGEPQRVAAFTNDVAVAQTTVTFAPIAASRLELRQPPSCGPAERPGILWLNELVVE